MEKKLPKSYLKNYLLGFGSLLLLGAVPYFAGSGLDNAAPIGPYLNYKFPATIPNGLPYEPVFPNLTFDSPLTFNEVPNANKIIVGQRDGKIYWFDKNPAVTTKNMMLDLSDKVGVVWDGGFLGLALHPKFGNSGYNHFYTWYTTKDANGNNFPNAHTVQNCDNEEYWGNYLILARYTANPSTLTVQRSTEQVLIKIRMYGTTHRGGGLLFGNDGMLYLTTGDQTAFKKAQDITNNIDGGVLRIDVDKDPIKSHAPIRTMPQDHGYSDEITGNGYFIPNDNPFLSANGTNFEEYYSMGHRNPHRMTIDRTTGKLYVGEIGGGLHEEINVIEKGKNYGWPVYEGLAKINFCSSTLYNNMPHQTSLTVFPRSVANSIIGGFVYRGNAVPELQGKYICADYGTGEEIFTVDVNTGAYSQLGSFTSTDIISFGEDSQNELYILKQGVSRLFKMVSKDSRVAAYPQLLSQTGAFKNLGTLEPADGLVPYELIESFWSDGAIKKRWLGVPNDGSHNSAAERIKYSDDIWDFPVGSVLIKHFELPTNVNNPLITKRLETRFSVKAENGKFYFLTYKWNAAQTDAQLLTVGLDENINVTQANGSQATQVWRYPSNSECITCHNESSKGTLGTRTRYLNSEMYYPKTGRTANQLVTLSHLGILDRTISDADTNSFLTLKAMDDPTATIDEKARSYMDLNCAYCHRPDANNRANFDLRLGLSLEQTGLLTASPIQSLGIPNEKIVDPGKPATSILYHRVNSANPSIMMPPLAKNKVDAQAVQLINDWIVQLGPQIRVTGVTLAPAAISLEVGASASLIATVNPANAKDKTVRWSSSNNAVATVDAEGKVTAIAVGTATITVTTNDGNFTKTSAITVTPVAPCTVIQEYRINGEWDSGAAEITVNEGDNVFVSMLPNDVGVDIKGPDGRYLNNFDLGAITVAKAGTYTIISEFGCSATLRINVLPASGCPPAGTACNDDDPTTLNDVEDGNCNCAGEPTASVLICVSIDRGSDDVEQSLVYTNTSTGSSNIQLVTDLVSNGGAQAVGLRFNNLNIPVGAIIESAYLRFTVDEPDSQATTVTIKGEAADNAATFTVDDYNVTRRPVTGASVVWNIPTWSTVGSAGPDQTSPNLAPIIDEIVKRPGFRANSSIALIIQGSGKRTAEAFETDRSLAARLCITYSPGPSSFKARLPEGFLDAEVDKNNDIPLFPNPTQGVLILDLANYEKLALQCVVYNSAQQQVAEFKFGEDHSIIESVDLSEMADGVYTLMIQSEKGILAKKVVIKK